jgi:hypothetical protein
MRRQQGVMDNLAGNIRDKVDCIVPQKLENFQFLLYIFFDPDRLCSACNAHLYAGKHFALSKQKTSIRMLLSRKQKTLVSFFSGADFTSQRCDFH